MESDINRIIRLRVYSIKNGVGNTFNNYEIKPFRDAFFESNDLFRWNLYMGNIDKLLRCYDNK